jgi:hypothetical protein
VDFGGKKELGAEDIIVVQLGIRGEAETQCGGAQLARRHRQQWNRQKQETSGEKQGNKFRE